MTVVLSVRSERTPRIVHRIGAHTEVTFAKTTKSEFGSDIYGQSLNNSALVAIANGVSVKDDDDEQTPAIACLSSTQCRAVYRAYDLNDQSTGIDRVKMRTLGF